MEPGRTTPTWLHRAVPPELHDSHYCVSGAAIELCGSRESLLARTVAHLGLPEMDIFDLFDSLNTKKNLKQFRGGQAHVYTWSWTNCDLLSARPSSPLIPDGAPVAFKHMMPPGVGRNFTLVKTEEDHQRAARHSQRALSLELNLLDAFHSRGCGDRVVKPLAMVCSPGVFCADEESRKTTWWEPTYGYLMPAYPRAL